MGRECSWTRNECHHPGSKCSECPVMDLMGPEFDVCVQASYDAGWNKGMKEALRLALKRGEHILENGIMSEDMAAGVCLVLGILKAKINEFEEE